MSTIQDRLIIGPALAGTLMTPAEFDCAEDWEEGYVYELINGVLIVTPPPDVAARGANGLLGCILRNYREDHPRGTSLDYTLADHTVATTDDRRRADRVIWTGLGRVPNVRREQPTIAIEFVSESRRDRRRDYEAKRDECLEIEIAEYWIIDRFRRIMTVFRRRDGGYDELVIREKETYTTPELPGFQLPLARVLAEADMLEQAQQEDGQ